MEDNKIRIDTLIVNKNILQSRAKAQAAIEKGLVKVNGKTVKKPSEKYSEFAEIDLMGQPYKYVSRAGEKLDKALCNFGISLLAKRCLDVGASTGGFTHCMLSHGARSVHAVDVGTSQLDLSLFKDKRVFSFENTDIRSFISDKPFDFIAADVSFISLKLISDALLRLSGSKTEIVVLVKPQFECGGEGISKNGVVSDKKVHCRVINDMIAHFAEKKFTVRGLDYSPIRGGEGNIEFLLYLDFSGRHAHTDVERIVDIAHKMG